MKKSLILITLGFTFIIQAVNAQQVSPELKRKINEAYTRMEYYNKTTPPLQKKIDVLMAGGNYYMSVRDWNNAIKCYNKVLRISPNNYEANQNRNFCRTMVKGSTPKRKKSTLQKYYENGGL